MSILEKMFENKRSLLQGNCPGTSKLLLVAGQAKPLTS